MNFPNNTIPQNHSSTEIMNAFMRGVYNWMALGLSITAVTAWLVVSSQSIVQFIFGARYIYWFFIIAELGLVLYLSFAINRMSPMMAICMFVLYSFLSGLTISIVFMIYTLASIFQAFLICAGMFAAMSIYGATTKRDLTSWGSFLFMGLLGIIIAMAVNIFIIRSDKLSMIISGIGVIVFTGLTAYDTQKLKKIGMSVSAKDEDKMYRFTIMGALTLYLDFINLFLKILRLTGRRR